MQWNPNDSPAYKGHIKVESWELTGRIVIALCHQHIERSLWGNRFYVNSSCFFSQDEFCIIFVFINFISSSYMLKIFFEVTVWKSLEVSLLFDSRFFCRFSFIYLCLSFACDNVSTYTNSPTLEVVPLHPQFLNFTVKQYLL